jgi:hypothetical protein
MSDRGVALILVLLAMTTLSALAMSLALLVSTESRVTANYRDGIETSFGAQAALERVLPDLAAEPDFDRVLTGMAVSSFNDGPAGPRRLPDGTFTDLHALTAALTCGRAVCRDADLTEVRDERPWGANNPRWQLYGHGPSTALGGDPSRFYAVVWVADDPSETDMDPLTDGGPSTSPGAGGAENPGGGRLSITAHAYGPAGARRIIEATVSRDDSGLRVLSWRETR